MPQSLAAEKLSLARDLVDDVELSRLAPEQLLLKTMRLARLAGDSATVKWLSYELTGYPNGPDEEGWARHFGRVTVETPVMGYWVPLASISGLILSMQTQIQTLQVPSIQFAPSSANPNEFVTGFAGATAQKVAEPAGKVLDRLQSLTNAVSTLAGIRSRVLTALHSCAVKTYHDLAFSGIADTIFERHRNDVDRLLLAAAPDVVEKISSIYDRLSEGDAEAISQALNSVRRMIKVFADRVYPPGEGTRELNGQSYDIGSDKVLNRIKLHLYDRCASKSRRERLSRTLRDAHERASAGSHADITAEEAKALFLQVYLVLGEILAATETPAPSVA